MQRLRELCTDQFRRSLQVEDATYTAMRWYLFHLTLDDQGWQ